MKQNKKEKQIELIKKMLIGDVDPKQLNTNTYFWYQTEDASFVSGKAKATRIEAEAIVEQIGGIHFFFTPSDNCAPLEYSEEIRQQQSRQIKKESGYDDYQLDEEIEKDKIDVPPQPITYNITERYKHIADSIKSFFH